MMVFLDRMLGVKADRRYRVNIICRDLSWRVVVVTLTQFEKIMHE